MNELKRQEIKNLMLTLWDSYESKADLAGHIIDGYIWGTYANSQHFSWDEIYHGLVAEILADKELAKPTVLNSNWVEPTCSKRVHLDSEAVKNIAIDALTLIEYVHANNLFMENVPGGANVYVNYINEQDQAVFESFGGAVEDNPYLTTTQLGEMTVAQLDAYYEELAYQIEGWNGMLKADKIAALTTLIYGDIGNGIQTKE